MYRTAESFVKESLRKCGNLPCSIASRDLWADQCYVIDKSSIQDYPETIMSLSVTYEALLLLQILRQAPYNNGFRGDFDLIAHHDADYTKQEMEKVGGYFLNEMNDPLGCRDRLCFFISHTMLCRSQTALGMHFADLFSFVLENQGIPEYVHWLQLSLLENQSVWQDWIWLVCSAL